MAKSFNDLLLQSGLKKVAVARMARMPLHRLSKIANVHSSPHKYEKVLLAKVLCEDFHVCKRSELLESLGKVTETVRRNREAIEAAKPTRKK